MPVSPSQIDWSALYAALPEGAASQCWQVVHIAPVRLTVEGTANRRRLNLGVDLYLLRSGSAAANRVRATLLSEPWVQATALPPVQQTVELTAEAANAAGEASAPLGYALCEATARAVDGNPAWLQYLHPVRVLVATDDEEPAGLPLEESLPRALGHWLAASLKVATVGEAMHSAQHGPLGHFGPVEARVLERSDEADLAVDATWLGEVDNATAQGDAATTRLCLYGERFGLWLLHRRVSRQVKANNKRVSAPDAVVQEVLVADTADGLMQLAGLAPLEKRLFQQAGVLPDATLWHNTTAADADDDANADSGNAATTEAGTPQQLDLSGVADRPRRQLHNLAALARQGKLNAADLDLLFRLARQLSRVR